MRRLGSTTPIARVSRSRSSARPSHGRCLGWRQHIAWDTYFIYPADVRWVGEEMPAPEYWFHQLRDREVWERTADAEFGTSEWTQALAEKSEADPAHFATGADLRTALSEAVTAAGSAQRPSALPPGGEILSAYGAIKGRFLFCRKGARCALRKVA